MINNMKNDTKRSIEEQNLKFFLSTEFTPYFAGIHIAGPNVSKTSIVILNGHPIKTPLTIYGLYEKIGSIGKLFSDDRILDILSTQKFYSLIFVDCPLSVPPCVQCEQEKCYGVLNCEDINVAYMLRLNDKLKKEFKLRKKRPINPQTQRISDIVGQIYVKNFLQNKHKELLSLFTEPSYNSNLIPLINRAKILQKRLNSLNCPYTLVETFIPLVLLQICIFYNLPLSYIKNYKDFTDGKKYRLKILNILEDKGWINLKLNEKEQICYSVENFHAFMCALTGALFSQGIFQTIITDHNAQKMNQIFIPSFFCNLPTVSSYLN